MLRVGLEMPEAQALLDWSAYPGPGVILDSGGIPWAVAADRVLLEGLSMQDSESRLICRTGCLDGPAFLTWGPQGWQGLLEACERSAHAGLNLLLVPHAHDVLSDVQRCLKLLTDWADKGIGVLVDPAALLTESMLDRAEDHLDRLSRALLPTHGVGGVVLSGVSASGEELPAGVFRPVGEVARDLGLPLVRTGSTSDELLAAYGLTANT